MEELTDQVIDLQKQTSQLGVFENTIRRKMNAFYLSQDRSKKAVTKMKDNHKNEIVEKEKKIDENLQKIQELRAEVEEYEKSGIIPAKRDEVISGLQDELVRIKKEVQANAKDVTIIENLRKQLKTAQEDNQTTKAELASRIEDVAVQKETIRSLQAEKDVVDQNVLALEKSIKKSKDELTEANMLKQTSEEEFSVLQSSTQESDSQHKSKIVSLNETIQEMSGKITIAEEKLTSYKKEQQEANVKLVDEHTEMVRLLNREKEGIIDQLKEMTKKVKDAKHLADKQQARIEELQTTISTKDSELTQAADEQKEIENLEEEEKVKYNEKMKAIIDGLRTELSDLKLTLSKNTAEHIKAIAGLETVQDEQTNLLKEQEREIAAQTEKITSITAEAANNMNTKQEQITELEADVAAKSAELEEFASLQEEFNKQSRELAQLRQETSDTASEIKGKLTILQEELNTSNETHQADKEALEEKNKRQTDDIAQKRQNLQMPLVNLKKRLPISKDK